MCEHVRHTEPDPAGHSYGMPFDVDYLVHVKTPYGTFRVCNECRTNCYADFPLTETPTVPPLPVTYYPFTPPMLNLHMAEHFVEALNCVENEFSPFDAHCDVTPIVGYLMGFYRGMAHRDDDINVKSAMLDDLSAILRHVINQRSI
jgi:hypothetical protein